MSGGGKLQNAKLGEGEGEEGGYKTPPNVGSDNDGFFNGGSNEFVVNIDDVVEEDVPLHKLLPGCIKKPPPAGILEFNGEIDNVDPFNAWVFDSLLPKLPSSLKTLAVGNTLSPLVVVIPLILFCVEPRCLESSAWFCNFRFEPITAAFAGSGLLAPPHFPRILLADGPLFRL